MISVYVCIINTISKLAYFHKVQIIKMPLMIFQEHILPVFYAKLFLVGSNKISELSHFVDYEALCKWQ